MTMMTCTLFGL